MKKKMIMAAVAAVFLNVSGAYADTVFAFGGAMCFPGDGGVGWNGFVPQVGYMSAEKKVHREIDTWIATPSGRVPAYKVKPLGWKLDGFEYSILFDITFGVAGGLNVSSGLTAEFYFLSLDVFGTGAGIGGGWGLIGFDRLLRGELFEMEGEYMPYPYGAPYIRGVIPVLLGTFKTGVYFDYYFMDEPYTQFNIIVALLI
jgi:hypothetical protein